MERTDLKQRDRGREGGRERNRERQVEKERVGGGKEGECRGR